MKKSKPEWDEVVEDEMRKYGLNLASHVEPEKTEMTELFRKYFGDSIPVRIKCRRGAILIERIKK